jgi:hypothetical protein
VVLVDGKEKRATGDMPEKVFSRFIPIFWYWGGHREAAEVALRGLHFQSIIFLF